MERSETSLVMSGNVEEFHLADLLQAMAPSAQCTAIVLRRHDGRAHGRIWLQAGKVLDAERGAERGLPAFLGLFATAEGDTFVVERMREVPTGLPDLGPLGPLLMEAIEHHEPPELEIEVDHATAPHDASALARRGTVVALASVRPGVGRSTIAARLGAALARRGLATVLVDTVGVGELAALADAPATRARPLDELDGDDGLEGALAAGAHPELRVVAVAPSPAFRPVTPDQWRSVLRRLGHLSDVILVDCPAGLVGAAADVIAGCDRLIGVVRADRGAPSAATTIERHAAGPALAGLVVNQFDARATGSVEAFQRIASVGAPLFETTIPRSEAVAGGAPDAIAWLFDDLAAEVAARLTAAGR